MQMQAHTEMLIVASQLNSFCRSPLAHHQTRAVQHAFAMRAHNRQIDFRAEAKIIGCEKHFFLQNEPI